MPPKPDLARERYRSYAKTYDEEQARNPNAAQNRRRVVELLRLQPGDIVLDVGCGTGLNFPLIEEAIRPEGRIIGLDLSAEMLAQARSRAEASGWSNVTLIESAIEDAVIPEPAGALLFSFTHDIQQSPAALENVFRHARPGARVAAVGYKWAPWWALPWNYVVWNFTRHAITTRDGFGKPWQRMQQYVPDLKVESAFLGAMYFAWGETPST